MFSTNWSTLSGKVEGFLAVHGKKIIIQISCLSQTVSDVAATPRTHTPDVLVVYYVDLA